MTKQEIKQAAKEFHESRFKSEELCRLEVSGYIQGMIMVNERQPYSKDDIVAAIVWVISKGYRSADGLRWWNVNDNKLSKLDEIIKLWEETRNEKKI